MIHPPRGRHPEYARVAGRPFKEVALSLGTLTGLGWAHQHPYVLDENGEIMVDYVCRHESLEEDFAKVCGMIGLPDVPELKRLNSSEPEDYRPYYDEESCAKVAQHYKRDLELFGYEF